MGTNIPKPDDEFNERQELITTAVVENGTSWGMDLTWIETSLIPKKMRWVNAWAACGNKLMRTPLITKEKNQARKEYEPEVRTLIHNLLYNTRVSDADLAAMGISKPSKSRTPAPPPATYPIFTVDTSVIRFLKIHFSDAESAGKGKPHGVHGAEIRWGISDTPVTNANHLPNSSFDTRSPFALEFQDEDRGRAVWIGLRWENTTGEKGPWSQVIHAIIP